MAAFLVGVAVAYIATQLLKKNRETHFNKECEEKIKLADKEAKSRIKKAEETIQHKYNKYNEKIQNERFEILHDIKEKQAALEKDQKEINQKKQQFTQDQQALKHKLESIEELKSRRKQLVDELSQKLETVAQMTQEEARKDLLDNVERWCRDEAGRYIKNHEEKTKKLANKKATEIILTAIENIGVETITANCTASVGLPDDEMKGRIIGKEGRNIRAFESATGVDVIIDDTPNAVILSCFDPIRRETGRLTMEALVQDGRIHPTRIEDCVEAAKDKISEIIQEKGEMVADQLNLEFHPEIIKLIGRLHYRTSYGQNILQHSLESAKIAGRIASEMGVDVNLAKRGTMLHDIGKAIDFEMAGSHDDLGAEMCKKYGESDELINCIMAHHEDEAPETVEAVIVKMADAFSSVRPGARKESVDLYIKRLENLEALALSFEGVEKAYAIQAGRELRVIVRPEDVKDEGMPKVASDIAKEIEQQLDYPGEVKVSIVRETRASSIAQ